MTENTAGWLQAQGIGAPTDYFAHGALLAQRQAEQAEREAEVAEARRQAELEEARDQRLTAQYLAGVQPGAAVQRALALQGGGDRNSHQAGRNHQAGEAP